ncbi:hypothetical protein [Clostridium cavendishii]|nr:hypothetical protein [Clostridium cavendishii]
MIKGTSNQLVLDAIKGIFENSVVEVSDIIKRDDPKPIYYRRIYYRS